MAKKVITFGEIMLRLAPEGYYDMVKDGENGLIFEKQNPYSLADCIARCV